MNIYSEEGQEFLAQFMGAAGTGLTTPTKISDEILTFADKVAGSKPFYVPVQGLACIGRCFMNVDEYCEQFGGTPVHGWMVWESPKPKRLNAEFHAIVKCDDGSYLDITRKPDKEKQIVFFPDPNREAFFSKSEKGLTVLATFALVEYPKCNVQATRSNVDSRWLEPFDFSKPYSVLP